MTGGSNGIGWETAEVAEAIAFLTSGAAYADMHRAFPWLDSISVILLTVWLIFPGNVFADIFFECDP